MMNKESAEEEVEEGFFRAAMSDQSSFFRVTYMAGSKKRPMKIERERVLSGSPITADIKQEIVLP